MKTILITGGAGFIGSNFTRHIFENYPDYRVLVVDALTYAGSIENLPVRIWENSNLHHPRFEFWYGNVMNGELMDTLVSQSDYIVHFAAESHVTRSIYDNTQFFLTDVIGTQTLANLVCKYKDRVQRFIHISTSEVYGTALTEKMDEEHPLNPMSPYAAAKAGADRLVYSYWRTYGIPAVIIRPFNNFGPFQHMEKAVPRFVTSCLIQEPLRLHGDGSASRDYVFVEDVCRAVDTVLHADRELVEGEVFNVATGQHRSILSIAKDIVGRMCKDESLITFVGDRPGQVFRHTGESSKITERLGWKPRLSWEEGLERTIAWYVDNRPWWEKQFWLRHVPITTSTGKRELH